MFSSADYHGLIMILSSLMNTILSRDCEIQDLAIRVFLKVILFSHEQLRDSPIKSTDLAKQVLGVYSFGFKLWISVPKYAKCNIKCLHKKV